MAPYSARQFVHMEGAGGAIAQTRLWTESYFTSSAAREHAPTRSLVDAERHLMITEYPFQFRLYYTLPLCYWQNEQSIRIIFQTRSMQIGTRASEQTPTVGLFAKLQKY